MKSLLFGIFLLAPTIALAVMGNDRGGGGAGITIDGQYMTLGEAKIKLPDTPMENIPSALDLFAQIQKMPLPKDAKSSLIAAILPLGERQYFDLRDGAVDPKFKKILLGIYKKLISNPKLKAKMTLYGFTLGTKTFLFQEFFSQNTFQQQISLFHEALWVVNAKALYEDVVRAELGFEKVFQNSKLEEYDESLYLALSKVYNRPFLPLLSAGISELHRLKQNRLSYCFGCGYDSNDWELATHGSAPFVAAPLDKESFIFFSFDEEKQRNIWLERILASPSSPVLKEFYRIRDHVALAFWTTKGCSKNQPRCDAQFITKVLTSAWEINEDTVEYGGIDGSIHYSPDGVEYEGVKNIISVAGEIHEGFDGYWIYLWYKY